MHFPISASKSRRFRISVSIRRVIAKKKTAKHVGISDVRNNISATRELHGGEFVNEGEEHPARYANWASVRYSWPLRMVRRGRMGSTFAIYPRN